MARRTQTFRLAMKWFMCFAMPVLIVLASFEIISFHFKIIANSDCDRRESEPVTNMEPSDIWAKAPRFSLMIRMYHGSVDEYWRVFAPSYLIFWPIDKWRSSDIILVFDAESLEDRQGATTLSLLPPHPKIKFENPPPPNTTCSRWRREGYSRQIYSTFYGDLFTDAPFIGFGDTDSFFITKVVPEDLFEDGKPRIFGYNQKYTVWVNPSLSIVPGKTAPGAFMNVISFPFIIRREHFAAFRKHVTSVYNATTFEEAFHKICTKYPMYSQFDMIAFYLWYYHRDGYAWHILDQPEVAHLLLWHTRQRMTNDSDVLSVSSPKIAISKHVGHLGHSDSFPFHFVIYDYICTAANFSLNVGTCSREPEKYRRGIVQSVELNLVTDFLRRTAYWDERRLPTNLSSVLDFPFVEQLPAHTKQLFLERNKILQLYNGSWYW